MRQHTSKKRVPATTLGVALWRARNQGAVTILGSATPAVDTYYQAQNGGYRLLTYRRESLSAHCPKLRSWTWRELLAGNRSIFSRLLQTEMERVLACKQQAILFLNRRGHSTIVLCRHCGLVAECPHCDLALTFHKVGRRLICHHCGYSEPQYHLCPSCGSNYVRDFGCGTQRVVSEARRLWPRARILRLDADTSARTGATDEIIHSFSQGRADILVGTQMVTKGLDIARVTLVGIVSADLTLNLPDPYAAERTFQLLEQVAGRTGRVNCQAERYCRRTLPIMLALQRLSDMIMLVFIGWSWSGENAICILRSWKWF